MSFECDDKQSQLKSNWPMVFLVRTLFRTADADFEYTWTILNPSGCDMLRDNLGGLPSPQRRHWDLVQIGQFMSHISKLSRSSYPISKIYEKRDYWLIENSTTKIYASLNCVVLKQNEKKNERIGNCAQLQ